MRGTTNKARATNPTLVILASAHFIDKPAAVYYSPIHRKNHDGLGLCEQVSDIARDIIFEEDEEAYDGDEESISSTVVNHANERVDGAHLEAGGQFKPQGVFVTTLKAIVHFPLGLFQAIRHCFSPRF